MVRKMVCLGIVLAAGLGVALAIELGEPIKDFGVMNPGGTGAAVFSTDKLGIRALVVYQDDDESGGYSEGDTVLGVEYFSVIKGRPSGSPSGVAFLLPGSPT